MRILRVADIPGDVPGGMHGYMINSARALAEMGHAVHHLFQDDLGSRPRGAGPRRLTVPWMIIRQTRRLRRRGERFDVIEIHEPRAAPYILASRAADDLPPCVVLSHGLEPRRWAETKQHWRLTGRPGPLKSRLLMPATVVAPSRYALRHAPQIVVLSSQDVNYLGSELNVPSSRISVAPTGVTDEFFEVPRPRPGRRGLRVLFNGSWIDRKGAGELAAAWGAVCRRVADAELTLLGTSAAPPERVLADFPPHSRDRVSVLPFVPAGDIPGILGAHDLFVLPSAFEGLPLAMLEAAAAGLACVVGATSGNMDFFPAHDPEASGGVLVPPRETAPLAAAIERFALDPALAPALGARARQRARDYSWRRTAQGLLTAFERAANGA